MSREKAATAAQWRAGARVALVERADEAAQHAPRQRRVLARAVAGLDDQAQHVREGDDQEQDEGERRQADVDVDLRHEDDVAAMLIATDGAMPSEPRRLGPIDRRRGSAMSGTTISTLSTEDDRAGDGQQREERHRASARVERLEGVGHGQRRRRHAGER